MMKRSSHPLLLVLALVLTFSLGQPAPAKAQMSLSELRMLVDGRLAQLWTIILTRQTIHYLNYGNYFQGLLTHGAIPADGADVYLDMQYSRPSDQSTTWVDFLDTDLPSDLPMALTIDVYEGPLGNGFVATVYVYFQGELYSRAKGIGPLRGELSHTWQKET